MFPGTHIAEERANTAKADTMSHDSLPKLQAMEKKQQQKIEKQHYDLSGPDIAVVAATINKQTASRNLLIPLLAKNLENSKADEGLHDVFLKTTDELRNNESTQVPEYRTTMRYKLCLHKVFRQNTPYKSAQQPPPASEASLLSKAWNKAFVRK